MTGPDPSPTDRPGPDDGLGAIIAAGAEAWAQLGDLAGTDHEQALAAIVADGQQADRALDELRAAGDVADAELYAAVLRLAADHPVYVPPPAPASRQPGPAGELGPVDSLATAADILRAYLDADPDEPVSTDRAYEALALVERLAAAGDNLLPPAAVAARLGVSVDTVRRLISEGQLPAVRLGYRTMRVPVEGLAAYRAQLAKGSGRSNRSKIGGQRPGTAENQAASTTP